VLLDALRDPSPGVSKAAARGLARAGTGGAAGALWEILRTSEHEHQRRLAVNLLVREDRWAALAVSLRALAEPSDDVAEAGRRLLLTRLDTWNKSFNAPPPGAVTSLAKLLDGARGRLSFEQARDIAFILQTYKQ
jgi:hypothetical protein